MSFTMHDAKNSGALIRKHVALGSLSRVKTGTATDGDFAAIYASYAAKTGGLAGIVGQATSTTTLIKASSSLWTTNEVVGLAALNRTHEISKGRAAFDTYGPSPKFAFVKSNTADAATLESALPATALDATCELALPFMKATAQRYVAEVSIVAAGAVTVAGKLFCYSSLLDKVMEFQDLGTLNDGDRVVVEDCLGQLLAIHLAAPSGAYTSITVALNPLPNKGLLG